MVAFVRGGGALVAGVATFYFVGWFGAALLSILLPARVSALLAFLGSAACGVLVARHLWRSAALLPQDQRPTAVDGPSPLGNAVLGALLVGGIGFVGGFFGPMILAPDANQGPLLGLFITGPLGVVLGAIGGFVYGLGQRKKP